MGSLEDNEDDRDASMGEEAAAEGEYSQAEGADNQAPGGSSSDLMLARGGRRKKVKSEMDASNSEDTLNNGEQCQTSPGDGSNSSASCSRNLDSPEEEKTELKAAVADESNDNEDNANSGSTPASSGPEFEGRTRSSPNGTSLLT